MAVPIHSQRSYIIGCSEIALSQWAVGINLVTAKFLLAAQVNFIIFMQIRFLLGALLLGAYVAWQKQPLLKNLLNESISKKDTLVFFWQAACGGFLFNILMMAGLFYTTASVASITFSAFPAFLAVLSWLLLKEKLTRTKVYAFILAVIGILCINLSSPGAVAADGAYYLGIFFIVLSMFPEAIFVILGKWHDCRLSPYLMSFWANVINALLFLPITIFWFYHHPVLVISMQQWCWILAYSLSGGVMFFIFWYRGINRIPATTTALITTVAPLSTCFLAWLILNETINHAQILGMIFVIISIVMGSGIFASLKTYARAEEVE